jgi:prepilin-type N-terminal cleavage/methylation domain-containing protein
MMVRDDQRQSGQRRKLYRSAGPTRFETVERRKGFALTELLVVIAIVCISAATAGAAVINVQNPGDGNDIGPNLEAAWDQASEGDTVLLPAGSFTIDAVLTLYPSSCLGSA